MRSRSILRRILPASRASSRPFVILAVLLACGLFAYWEAHGGPVAALRVGAPLLPLFGPPTAVPAPAGAVGPVTTWVDGDVFVASADTASPWSYRVYNNNGQFKEEISDGLGGLHTGCAFDRNGDLYTTNLSQNRIFKFAGTGSHTVIQTINTNAGAGGGGNPESIVFAASGDFYVGNSGLYSSGPRTLQRYNAAGVLQQTYSPAVGAVGVDWIDLAADQHTMFYASEGGVLMRYDVAGAGAQLPAFSTSGSSFVALRILPPGDGSQGVLVANGYSGIARLDAAGNIVRTYSVPGLSRAFAMNLDPNGTSFWTGDLSTGKFYRLNISTGAVEIGPIDSGVNTIAGICVKGEITASQPTPTPPGQATATPGPAATATPVPGNLSPTATRTPRTLPPTITPAPQATVCADSQPLAETFESGTLGSFAADGAPGWRPATGVGHSGALAAFAPGVATVADERLVTTSGLSIPAGTRTATLSFWQSYAFELDFDGGVLELSNNGGASWDDAAPYIAAGAYNGTLSPRYGNPLAGRQAWTGNSHGYVPVTVDLRVFAGQTILLRFRAGMDTSNAEAGWLIDDVTLAIRSCAGTPPNGCQLPFTDVPASQPFYPYIHCLACYGIVAGYQDGTYRPGANVTRGQLAKIIANGAGFTETPAGQTFMDVPPGSPFWTFVERLAMHDAIGGYTCGGSGEPCDGSGRSYFRPGANATRGQIAKIIAGAAGITDVVPSGQQTFADVPPSQPFWPFIERLATRGIIGGYSCGGPGEPCGNLARPYFRPSNATTRGQMAKIAGNTFFPGCYIGLRQ